LLHDVGKIHHRAASRLSQAAERMEQMLCPTGQAGRATHRHVLWTSDFVTKLAPRLPDSLDASLVARLAAAHHRPTDPREWLIAEADRLASGHDRRDDEKSDRPGFRRVPLESVFCRLRLAGDGPVSTLAWMPGPLEIDRSLLPGRPPDGPHVENAWAALAGAMDRFAETVDLRGLPGPLAVQALAGMSERFQSLVPASAMNRPDVSLHDHAAVTAAIACAMYQYHHRSESLTEKAVRDRDATKFRFVVGSLAGIQDFIFALPGESQKGIAKTFRARSFYLSVLTEAVVLRLLEALELPPTNCVLNAGGRFVILADSSRQSHDALRRTDDELQQWFLHEHLGTLGLNLAYDLVVRGRDMLSGNFAEVYQRLELSAERAKLSRLKSCMQDETGWLAERFLHDGRNPRDLDDETNRRAVALGKALTKARSFGLFRPGAVPEKELLARPLDCCGLVLQLSEGLDMPAAGAVSIARVADSAGDGTSWFPIRPLANHVPILSPEDVKLVAAVGAGRLEEPGDDDENVPGPGRPATFEHLALLSRRQWKGGFVGRAMLACLKADVDRLGLLFRHGFGRDISFARVASASRLLDLFFKGYLTHRMERPGCPYRKIYTVFAGGDDLMLIGPWHVMFDFALDLRGWLDELTGHNPDLTLSAALVLGHAKLPPSHMARLAEEHLRRAKEAGRNAVSVLGRVMSWDDFRRGLEIGRRLDRMLRGAESDTAGDGITGDDRDGAGRCLRLPAGFVHRLLQYARMAEGLAVASRDGKAVPLGELTWRSHFLYDLHRNVEERLKDDARRYREDLDWLRNLLVVDVEQQAYRPVILGATYALYLNRGAAR
ncbi:MAG: hypothetical protein J7M21_06065, partial [Planctomycetes bacterium]|nr:hypothetical protein [Planctomycetota bacterium]